MLSLLSFALFGLVIGAIARLLIPGDQGLGILGTMVVGIVGSLVGGTIGSLLFDGQLALTAAGWIGSLIGTVAVLLVMGRYGSPRRIEG